MTNDAEDADDDNHDNDHDDDEDGQGDDEGGRGETEGKEEITSILIHPNSRSPAPAARILIVIMFLPHTYSTFGMVLNNYLDGLE